MTEPFRAYGVYYDLLYQDKDYPNETSYIIDLVSRFGVGVTSVLELGCGTGRHGELLASSGYDVDGVELSKTMLQLAVERSVSRPQKDVAGRFKPHEGDVRWFRMGRAFGAVISLFHVVSYQTSNADVLAMFETARQHLDIGGVFVFDVWFGPAVLTNRPEVRVKRIESEAYNLLRVAEPTVDVTQNRVDVKYLIVVTDKRTGAVSQFTETHPMRYFFPVELALIAQYSGFELIHSEEWMTGKVPSSQSWGVVFVARKVSSI